MITVDSFYNGVFDDIESLNVTYDKPVIDAMADAQTVLTTMRNSSKPNRAIFPVFATATLEDGARKNFPISLVHIDTNDNYCVSIDGTKKVQPVTLESIIVAQLTRHSKHEHVFNARLKVFHDTGILTKTPYLPQFEIVWQANKNELRVPQANRKNKNVVRQEYRTIKNIVARIATNLNVHSLGRKEDMNPEIIEIVNLPETVQVIMKDFMHTALENSDLYNLGTLKPTE